MRTQCELLSFSVLCIIKNSIIPSVFETVFVVGFASQLETDY
jgi:hypothetical protein